MIDHEPMEFQFRRDLGHSEILKTDQLNACRCSIERILARMGYQPSDIEDAWQEAIVALIRHEKRFHGYRHLHNWLARVAINALHHSLRRCKRREAAERRRAVSETITHHVWDEAGEVIDIVLGSIGQSERENFLAFYRDMVPASSLAERAGATVKAFHAKLHRTRIKLQKRLREREIREN